jgi:hypothetical protein
MDGQISSAMTPENWFNMIKTRSQAPAIVLEAEH